MNAFDKLTLNNGVTLKNKLWVAPMTTYSGYDDGNVSEEELAYYKVRSGGASLVMTAVAYVSESGKGFHGQISAHDDAFIPSLKKMADTIKAEGAKAVLQIFHAGNLSPADLVPEVVGASRVTAAGEAIPRELTEMEVKQIVRDFYEATRRAIQAGFDGVEIHGANGYLLQQFFSSYTNTRTDQYGADRLGFILEVIEAVNKAKQKFARKSFIVGYRFSPEEPEEEGITLDQTLQLVDVLASQDLQYLHISQGHYNSKPRRYSGDAKMRVEAIQQKIAGRLPLVNVGGIFTREDLTEAEQSGADILAVGRALLIEPRWVEKIQNGEPVKTELDPENLQVLPTNLFAVIQSNPGWVPTKGVAE